MATTTIRYLLDDKHDARCIRVVSGAITLAEGAVRSWVTLTRTGSFTDPRYGRFEITAKMLADMVRNFDLGTYGQDVFLDVAHKPEDGAAAKILELKTDGARLRAQVEWTPFGLSAVRERGFRYLSADFFDDFIDNERGQSHGAVLRGAGLTIRPVIKRLDPVQLSESLHPSGPALIAPGLVRELTESLEMTMNKWLTELQRRLAQKNLSEAAVKALSEAFSSAAKALGEDESALESLVKQLSDSADALVAAPAAPIQLSVSAGLGAEAVNAAVAKALAERDDAVKQLAERTQSLKTAFDTALADGGKALSEPTLAVIRKARDVIAPTMTAEQVKTLAETQIALGQQLEAARQLSAMGFGPAGSPRVSVSEGNTIKKLSEDIRTGLRQAGATLRAPADASKDSPFVTRVLAEFDATHAHRLHNEARMLADGVVGVGDTALPASYQREVLRESLHDLRVLDLVNARVDATTAATHNIPFETRDLASITNGGLVSEGGEIPMAGISQSFELAYIRQMKLGLEQSNEVMFFSRNNSLINWDAWGRNIASNARAVRELISLRIANEMQRCADAYAKVAVATETLTSQTNGSRTVFKLANFPLVRPHQVRDLQGNAVGAVENPITITYNSVARTEYDGTGTQAAGIYWRVVSYNLGTIQLVTEAGAVVTPPSTTAFVVNAYTYSTNVLLVDTDIPSGSTYEKHMNKLLQAVGNRKAVLSSERYVMADFGIGSPVLHNMITDAENFEAGTSRPDVGISATGTLGPIKGIGQWDTNAPGLDLGEERLLLGRRGDFAYTIAKPFSIGAPFEKQVNGKPVGKQMAYGEEYSSLHVPTRLREGFTSVIAYSATARAAI